MAQAIDETKRTEGLVDAVALGAWMDTQGLDGEARQGLARVAKGDSDNPKAKHFGDVALDRARKAGELAARTPLRHR